MASITLPPLVGPGARVFGEEMAGLTNGANLTYSTSGPFLEGSEVLYLNGRRLLRGCDYTVSESGGAGAGFDTVALMVLAPKPGDAVIIDYTAC